MEEPGGLQSMGSQGVGYDWGTSLSFFTFLHWRRKWQPTPVFLPGESRDGGAWWAAGYGVAQSRAQLTRLSSSSSMGWHIAIPNWKGRHLHYSKWVLCNGDTMWYCEVEVVIIAEFSTWSFAWCSCYVSVDEKMLQWLKTIDWSITVCSGGLTHLDDREEKSFQFGALALSKIWLVEGFSMKGTLKFVEDENTLSPLVSERKPELW